MRFFLFIPKSKISICKDYVQSTWTNPCNPKQRKSLFPNCQAISQSQNQQQLVSECLEHIKHISMDKALCVMYTCNISLVLILFKTAIQTKILTFEGALILEKELRNGKLRLD